MNGNNSSRMDDMLLRYGECVNRKTASTILGVSRTTFWNLEKNGMIRTACGGDMIDVRSLCEYIETPEKKVATRKRSRKAPRMEIIV